MTPAFAARNLDNFLWVAFTRSDPARDIHGLWASTEDKHWGCRGPLIIDARIKPHHAPPLVEDPAVSRRVDELAGPGQEPARTVLRRKSMEQTCEDESWAGSGWWPSWKAFPSSSSWASPCP